MGVPSVKEIIFFKSELNALRAEAMLDLLIRKKQKIYPIMFDIDGSRKIREKGIILRLEVIQHVLRFIESQLSKGEFVFWYGNDEILVILQADSMEEATSKADDIRQSISTRHIFIEEPVENVSYDGCITVTGGIVNFDECHDVMDVIRLSKSRIALAKEQGRNCIDQTASEQCSLFTIRITTNEELQLTALCEKRRRTQGSLLREAVDTLLLHYPQFHGHRRDREQKMPKNAFTYACTPAVTLEKNRKEGKHDH
ncbi:diguanylate cyclase [compost metagenome]